MEQCLCLSVERFGRVQHPSVFVQREVFQVCRVRNSIVKEELHFSIRVLVTVVVLRFERCDGRSDFYTLKQWMGIER